MRLIAAPKPELFDIEKDPGEQTNLVASPPVVRATFGARGSLLRRAADGGVDQRAEASSACARLATPAPESAISNLQSAIA